MKNAMVNYSKCSKEPRQKNNSQSNNSNNPTPNNQGASHITFYLFGLLLLLRKNAGISIQYVKMQYGIKMIIEWAGHALAAMVVDRSDPIFHLKDGRGVELTVNSRLDPNLFIQVHIRNWRQIGTRHMAKNYPRQFD